MYYLHKLFPSLGHITQSKHSIDIALPTTISTYAALNCLGAHSFIYQITAARKCHLVYLFPKFTLYRNAEGCAIHGLVLLV